MRARARPLLHAIAFSDESDGALDPLAGLFLAAGLRFELEQALELALWLYREGVAVFAD